MRYTLRYTFKVLRYILANYVSHVHISHCQQLIDSVINLYIQKEQLILLDDEGHPSLFAPIMIATLSTCSQLERDNISYRLQSGRKRYIEKGGKLGRKVVSLKTAEQMKTEYREVISLLRKGIFRSGCGKVEWLRGKYRTTSEAVNESTITAIFLLILRSFQRKGLCNSGLKAKNTTFECC